MFIRKPPTASKLEYVNLKNVSYINETDENFVFNMCFSYTDRLNRVISHQHFIPKSNDDFKNSDYFKENFVEINGDDRTVYVNKNFVASIIAEESLDTANNKIIVCFTNSVTKQSQDINPRLIPEYLYIRMADAYVNTIIKDIVKLLY